TRPGMSESSAILPPRMASKSHHSAWQRRDAGFAGRFRKQIVATTLIFADSIAAAAATSLNSVFAQLAGVQPVHNQHLPIALLIGGFFCLRLYTGCGPSPYEGFRLRAIGIASFVAIDLLIHAPVAGPSAFFLAGLAACDLLIFGHYIGEIIRVLLTHLGLWGASTALVGCGDKSRELAALLKSEPALGLRPIGFIGTPNDGVLNSAELPLPLLGSTTDVHSIPSHIEVAIFHSAVELQTFTSNSMCWTPS